MLNDAAWPQWVGGLAIHYPTIITMAIAAFLDRGPVRAMPRWFGYVNLWLVLLPLPGQMIFFFQTGPLARTASSRSTWPSSPSRCGFPVAFHVLRKAVLAVRAEQERAGGDQTGAGSVTAGVATPGP